MRHGVFLNQLFKTNLTQPELAFYQYLIGKVLKSRFRKAPCLIWTNLQKINCQTETLLNVRTHEEIKYRLSHLSIVFVTIKHGHWTMCLEETVVLEPEVQTRLFSPIGLTAWHRFLMAWQAPAFA
eukprot:sb/3475680/